MNITDKFTLEEIYLIKTCNTHDKNMAIQLFQTYLDHVAPQMAEMIRNLLDRLRELSEEEFAKIVTYAV